MTHPGHSSCRSPSLGMSHRVGATEFQSLNDTFFPYLEIKDNSVWAEAGKLGAVPFSAAEVAPLVWCLQDTQPAFNYLLNICGENSKGKKAEIRSLHFITT